MTRQISLRRARVKGTSEEGWVSCAVQVFVWPSRRWECPPKQKGSNMLTLSVLDPRAEGTAARPHLAPRLDNLKGKKVGVVMIHFPWHSWYVIADRLEELAHDSGEEFTIERLDLSGNSDSHFTGAGRRPADHDQEKEQLTAF